MTETHPEQCPHCGMTLDEDVERLCPYCGKELTAGAAAPRTSVPPPLPTANTEPPKNPSPLPPPVAPARADPQPTTRTGPAVREVQSVAPVARARQTTPTRGAEVEAGSVLYCPDLEVRYNSSRVFIVGAVLHFDLEFKILRPGLSDLEIEMATCWPSGREFRHRERVMVKLKPGMRIPRMINFAPELHGAVALTFWISYRRDGELLRFEAQLQHKIYPKESRAQEVIANQVNNLNIQISAGHAADIQVRAAREYLEQLRSATAANDPLWVLLDRLDDIPPVMATLELLPSETGPETERPRRLPPPKAPCARLSLVLGQQRVLVMTGRALQLGRSRKCDLVTRLFDASGQQKPLVDQEQVSRFHCRLEVHGKHCLVADKGFNPETGETKPSKCGTYLNGQRILPPGQGRELAVGVRTLLTLAGADQHDPRTFALEVYPWRCEPARGPTCPFPEHCDETPACVLLKRKDGVPEMYVVVWKCCPLGLAHPALEGLHIWREQNALAYRLGGTQGWLEIGSRLDLPMGSVQVEAFQQTGLKPADTV